MGEEISLFEGLVTIFALVTVLLWLYHFRANKKRDEWAERIKDRQRNLMKRVTYLEGGTVMRRRKFKSIK